MLSVPDRNQLLRRAWLFSELDDRELGQVAALARERACRGGDILVHQGDTSGDLFTVVQGRLKVGSVLREGEEVLFGLLGPGDIFGELALLDDQPRSATVVAAEPCRLLVLSRASFRHLLLQAPALAVKLLQVMAGRVRQLSTRAEDRASLDVSARLAKTLLDLAARFGGPAVQGGVRINVRISQRELGRLIGATREMVNKCLREWSRRGAIRHGRGLLVVRKSELLEMAVGEQRPQNRRRRPRPNLATRGRARTASRDRATPARGTRAQT